MIKETVEEWAGDNGLSVTDEQIEELVFGIQVAREMEIYTTGWTPGHNKPDERDKEIARLKSTIEQLYGYLREKGFKTVWADSDGVRETVTYNYGTIFATSTEKYDYLK